LESKSIGLLYPHQRTVKPGVNIQHILMAQYNNVLLAYLYHQLIAPLLHTMKRKKKSIPQVLAANIKKRRTELGLTQFTLAERLGLSTTYIAELEIAKKSPSIEVVQRLSDTLGMRPYELFLEEGVDGQLNDSRETLRHYVKEATIELNDIVKKTLQELANKHLDK
jgi:transcriptional regulator with XRE-family HTH domain